MDSGGAYAGAYGAGRAGSPFNPLEFIKKPHVILRFIALFFSIIVFSCIASRGYDRTTETCLYNGDVNACQFGIGIGVMSFLICIGFLILDGMFNQISGVQHRKYAVIADIGVSAVWCFLWLVAFSYLTDSWRKTDVDDTYGKSDVEAAIAFSFFSVASWAGLVVLAVLRYRKGVTEEFSSPDQFDTPQDTTQNSNPYAAFGGETDQYQPAPFSAEETTHQTPSDYQPPTY